MEGSSICRVRRRVDVGGGGEYNGLDAGGLLCKNQEPDPGGARLSILSRQGRIPGCLGIYNSALIGWATSRMPSRLQCSALMVGIVGVLRTYWAWPDVGAFAQRRGGAATTAEGHWTSSQRLMCRRRSTRPIDFAPICSDF